MTGTGHSGAAARVVHIEDDDVIREATALGLSRIGYEVHGEADGLEGLEYLRGHDADIVLLDVMLPGMSGAALCRRVRQFSDVPIIMLSARHDNVDIVAGLDAGADDYVAKPVTLDVLDARIRALLRRVRGNGVTATAQGLASVPAPGGHGGPAPQRKDPSAADLAGDPRASGGAADGLDDAALDDLGEGLLVDRDRLSVTLHGKEIHLTPTEWRLLLLLIDERGRVITRERLLHEAWEDAWAEDTRLADVHIQRLRRKVGLERIGTVRGFGYRWND